MSFFHTLSPYKTLILPPQDTVAYFIWLNGSSVPCLLTAPVVALGLHDSGAARPIAMCCGLLVDVDLNRSDVLGVAPGSEIAEYLKRAKAWQFHPERGIDDQHQARYAREPHSPVIANLGELELLRAAAMR